jgi:UDP-N-acetylmuramyl pentapeptide phosphotransferase/UDP-N-acetylglucosamine-1-phosphate transferase
VAYAMGVFMVIFSMGATQNVVWWFLPVIFLLYLGFVNAVNFMDGINGLVPLQGIVTLLGMLLSDRWVDSSTDMLVLLGWLIAFACFNLRNRSALFLGDAGSIGLGFILFRLVLPKLMSGDFGVLMFFVVMGVDVVWVLCMRLYRRENIFERHEKHLYQKLVLLKFYSPVAVSVGYAIVQFGIIILGESLHENGHGSEVFLGLILMLLFLAVIMMHRWIDESVGRERRG